MIARLQRACPDLILMCLVREIGGLPSSYIGIVVPKIVVIAPIVSARDIAAIVARPCPGIFMLGVIVAVGLFTAMNLVLIHSLLALADREPVCPAIFTE